MLRYVSPSREKVQRIIDDMREGDVEELAAGGWAPEDLHQFVQGARVCVIAEVNRVPCAIFGVTKTGTLLNPRYSPWMLGATELHKHPRHLLSESKKIVYTVLNEFEELENWVYEGSESSVRWLTWLGFTIEAPVPVGPEGQKFHKFWIKKEG